MQDSPMSSGTNLSLKTVGIALLVVSGIAGIYYIVNSFAGSTYAWFAVFLILINIYLIYRATIRRKLGEKIFGERDFTNSSSRPTQKVTADDKPDIQTQKDAYAEIQHDYNQCPSCDSEVIPSLNYCEDCGYQFEE